MKSIELYKAARRVSVPLVNWRTPDASATIAEIMESLNGKASEYPVLQWDSARGFSSLSTKADDLVRGEEPVAVLDFNRARSFPKDTILFILNAHRVVNDGPTVQALWNLRDRYKTTGSMAIMLSRDMITPPELASDTLTIEEELPDGEWLGRIVDNTWHPECPKPSVKDRGRAIDAMLGLDAYAAEQALALSFVKVDVAKKGLTKEGGKGNSWWALDYENLWERKRQDIEATPGLKVWRGGEKFGDIQGVANAKKLIRSYINGRSGCRGIVWMDEFEKAMMGNSYDSSKGDAVGTILSFMEDRQAQGVLFIGQPGSAKSMLAKASGSEANVPTIRFDMGGMRGEGLVGQAENAIRRGLKVVESVTQGKALFIATCNSIADIPAAMQRRFTLGVVYFGLPSAEERKALWSHYLSRYKLEKLPGGGGVGSFDDTGWTGADIKNCVKRLHDMPDLGTLKESATYATPIARTSPESVEALEIAANGRFISASAPGIYSRQREQTGTRRTRE